MRFAADIWLWGVLAAVLLGVVFVGQGLRLSRDRKKFGQESTVRALLTAQTSGRRAASAVITCLAVACAFVAAAQPQYGRGTRVLPATNLDVVLVLDFSKSMYARDISPSRIERAKVEVARLVRELGGARFGAVAFAGESISFPLTSDGAAIAQFFRGLEPNDMPLGGTAIARALDSGRQLLERDPLSRNHERVIILITDGEDLEGNPVEVARSIRTSGIRVEVVQIGGQSPEPIPEIGPDGDLRGLRKDESGSIMTTALSPEGEAQLAQVAREGGGQVVRAASGQVGIDEMTGRLRRLMTEELSERVETVYADVFHYPLAAAVVLLMLEVWIGAARRRSLPPEPPPGKRRRKRLARLRSTGAALVVGASGFSQLGCDPVDRAFERESPVVNEAISELRAEKYDVATQRLVEYLETGPCEAGVIGVGDRARELADASYDLALVFSASARGERGDAASPGTVGGANAPAGLDEQQGASIECALRLLLPLGPREDLPPALRARAYFLAGNLEMARGEFQLAVDDYDAALLLTPGIAPKEEGDPLGRDVAYNRALALRLLKEKQEQEQEDQQNSDQSPDEESESDQESNEEGDEQEKDPSEDETESSSDGDGSNDPSSGDEDSDEDDPASGADSEDSQEPEADPQGDEGNEPEDQESSSDDSSEGGDSDGSSARPEQSSNRESESSSQARAERMLDLLEQAPTLQQHDAEKRQGARVRGRMTMEDK